MKQQPMYHPIGRYYSSRTHPLPLEVEAYIERLPLAQKFSLATALMNQCNAIFANAPSLSIIRPTLTDEDTAS